MSENKEVKLTTGRDAKKKSRSFPIVQANKLLKMANPQWKLDDKGFKWNGTEIAKAVKNIKDTKGKETE